MAGPNKSLKTTVESNPTALGDPVSLKAEKDDGADRNEDKSQTADGDKSLKDIARRDLDQAQQTNRSMLGDPVSLKAENSDTQVDDDGMGGVTDNKGRDSKL